MTTARQVPPGSKNVKQLVAVTSVALPVVMLSSLALAQPASASAPESAPAKSTASLLANTARAVAARTASMPASMVATAVPASFAPARVPAPAHCTVVPGDTISAIAARYGLDTRAVLRLNHLGPTTLIHPGQRIKLTGAAAHAPARAAAPSVRVSAPASPAATYRVRAGDTISAIAARHGLGVSQVLRLNGLRATSVIYPGQTIKLGAGSTSRAAHAAAAPAQKAAPAAAASYSVKAGDTISAIAARHGLGVAALLRLNGLSARSVIYPGQKIRLGGAAVTASHSAAGTVRAAAPAPAPASGSYTIKAGDTLSGIAARHNVSLSALLKANNLKVTSIIYAGKKLALPGTVSVASSSAPTQLVPSTFLTYTYPEAVVAQANINKAALMAAPVPSPAQMKQIIASTARKMGVDPSLALGFAWQESGFNQQAVSPANAIGTMQVIPQSGEWASELVGRHLNLLDPYDNVTAGVAIIRALVATSSSTETAIAGYYQGQTSVARYGMFKDTKSYVAAVKANQALFR